MWLVIAVQVLASHSLHCRNVQEDCRLLPSHTLGGICMAGHCNSCDHPVAAREGQYCRGVCFADWFEGLRPEQYIGRRYNIELNKYKVKAGQNQAQWEVRH